MERDAGGHVVVVMVQGPRSITTRPRRGLLSGEHQ